MPRVIDRKEQLGLLREVIRGIHEFSKIERLAAIAAYAVIVGQIRELNLKTIMDYARITGKSDDEMLYHLLRFYVGSGMVNVVPDGTGVLDKINDNWEFLSDESSQEVATIMVDTIRKMRRRYLSG